MGVGDWLMATGEAKMCDEDAIRIIERARMLGVLSWVGVLAAVVGVLLWMWGAYVAHADMLLPQPTDERSIGPLTPRARCPILRTWTTGCCPPRLGTRGRSSK